MNCNHNVHDALTHTRQMLILANARPSTLQAMTVWRGANLDRFLFWTVARLVRSSYDQQHALRFEHRDDIHIKCLCGRNPIQSFRGRPEPASGIPGYGINISCGIFCLCRTPICRLQRRTRLKTLYEILPRPCASFMSVKICFVRLFWQGWPNLIGKKKMQVVIICLQTPCQA